MIVIKYDYRIIHDLIGTNKLVSVTQTIFHTDVYRKDKYMPCYCQDTYNIKHNINANLCCLRERTMYVCQHFFLK